MAEDEIMIEDDAIALEDTDDSVEADADVSNIITLKSRLKSLNFPSTLLTGSLSNKVIIQLLIVSYY